MLPVDGLSVAGAVPTMAADDHPVTQTAAATTAPADTTDPARGATVQPVGDASHNTMSE